MPFNSKYLYQPISISILGNSTGRSTSLLRFWMLCTAIGILLEWLVHSVWQIELPFHFLDLPLSLPLFPSFIIAVVFTISIGLGFGLVSFGISALFLGYFLNLSWWQYVPFALPFLFSLGLYSLCYQTISIGYKLTSLPSIIFFIFVSFLAATWASIAAIIYSLGIDTPTLILNWESWWIALFFQIVMGSGLLIVASRGILRKIKSGLILETENWSFPGEKKVLAFITVVFLVLIFLLLLLNYFSGLTLRSSPLPIYLSSIRLVHWIIFLLVQVLAFLIYYISKTLVNSYRKERSRFEASMKTKHLNLAKVDMELQKTNNELRTFLYRASHDIQGPLASIMGLAELAQLQISDPASLELFQRVKTSSKKLKKKILELIEVAEIKEDYLQPQLIDFSKVMNQILDNMDIIEGANQVEVFVNNSNLLPFHSDMSLIRSIFQNLLINSIDYRRIQDGKSWVKIEILDTEAGIKIMVTDNGKGIEKNHKHRVFDMFYRASETSKGSGLGLYLVKNSVSKLNGKISLVSEAGAGTRIVILLPSLPLKLEAS